MARGKKSLTIEERLSHLLEEKKFVEETLTRLNTEQMELENQIKMNRLSKLDELISKSGKSFEEIENILSGI